MTATFVVRVKVDNLEPPTIKEAQKRLLEEKGVLSVQYDEWNTQQENARPQI